MALMAIGSESEIKLAAVNSAIIFAPDDQNYSDFLDFEAIPGINSGVRDAPDGHAETMQGALNRAHAAAKARPGAFGIGLEGGMDVVEIAQMSTRKGFSFAAMFSPPPVRHGFGISWVALVTPSGREILVQGLAIPMPIEYINEVRAAGCMGTTIGHVVVRQLGGDHRDPYVTVTKGAITRADTFKPAVLAAVLMARDEIVR